MGLLIDNGVVLTVNDEHDVFEPGHVLVQGDRIVAVGAGSATPAMRGASAGIIDASGCAVLPGLVNAHVHLFQTLLRGSAPDRDLLRWLFEVAFPLYEHMQPGDVYLGTLQGIVEAVRGGSTAVIDNFTVRVDPEGYDAVFRAAEEAGVRYTMARGFSEIAYPESLRETAGTVFEEMQRLHAGWHGRHDGRLRLAFNPNVPWAVTDETMLRANELALEWEIKFHLHTAESEAEVVQFMEVRGARHVEWLERLGILGPHFTLAHSVWVSKEEIALIALRGATTTYNPVCNMYVASGVAPVVEMVAAGIPVALGTDGQTCNNGQEILDILKWAVNLQKAHHRDPRLLPPAQLLRMVCNCGARAFGDAHRIGSLEVGKKADLVVVDMSGSRLCRPRLDVASALVNYGRSSDVRTVIVDGKVLMRDGVITFVDEKELQQAWQEAKLKLWERAAVPAGGSCRESG